MTTHSQISLECQPPVAFSDPQPDTTPLNHLPGGSSTVTPNSNQTQEGVLCSAYRANPGWEFFQPPRKPPQEPAPGAGQARELRNARILVLRNMQMSIHRIADALAAEGCPASLSTIATVIREAGLPRLPRRSAAMLADITGPDAAPVADRRAFRLEEGTFRTRFGGLFVFAPMLAELDLEGLLAGMPGGDMIPAGCAWRALLALKLWGIGRPSQAMAEVFDPGLALFAGLNTMPKRSTLTEYTTRVDPRRIPALMHDWNRAIRSHGLVAGASFDLDFHTIPYHGDQALIEKHYVSKRSRRQNGILAFLARDAEARVFCYADATIRKSARNDAILRFVEDYREEAGVLPAELVFDSRLTTRSILARLDQMKIRFLTLRRRSGKMMQELRARPDSDWRRIRLTNIGRRYRHPRLIDSLRARPRTIESDIVEFLIERLAASWWAQLFARMTFGVRPTGLRGDHCACMCDGCVSSKSAIEGPAGCGIGRCRQGTEEWPNRYNATLLFVWMHVEV